MFLEDYVNKENYKRTQVVLSCIAQFQRNSITHPPIQTIFTLKQRTYC